MAFLPNTYPTSLQRPNVIAPAPGGSTPSTPAAPNATWQGGGDLRSTLSLPTTSTRLGMAQNMTDSAANSLFSNRMPQWGSIGTPDFGASRDLVQPKEWADVTEARRYGMDALRTMQDGPDREALTSRAWQRLLETGQPAYEQDLRKVNQYAAAGGRLGAGMTTNELTDVYTQRQRDLDRSREALIDNAVSQQLSDRALQLQGAQSLFGQLSGEDRATAGMLADLEQADYSARDRERTGAYDAGYRELQAKSNIMDQMQGFEGQIDASGRADRNEFRGERDWQNMLQNQATDRSVQQLQLQDQLYGNQFNREQARLNLLGGTGYIQPNVGPIMAGGAQAQQQANSLFGVAGGLLGGWGRQQAMGGSAATPPINGYYGNQPGSYYYGN